MLLDTNPKHYHSHTPQDPTHKSFRNQLFHPSNFEMAIPKRRNQEDHDWPAAKKHKTNTTFTIDTFMADFPPTVGPLASSNSSPLPTTFLDDEEMQDGNVRKPPRRSTFNIKLPVQLEDHDNAPYDWMKKQYSHCIIPEIGEEYNFAFESSTFYCLRDLHNARVRIRDGECLLDYHICSLATRWVSLEEEDRPASYGYLANGEVFVATCLPIGDVEDDALQQYFETSYPMELSAQHYIPRSKYSVHFVGKPNENEEDEIQAVNVGSVLIRNTRTGEMVYIDTGAFASRVDRARKARNVLTAWLEFQKEKCPTAKLGPISYSEPLILDVDKETHPTLRSMHALVSASLFIRRRITNWGDVKAFRLRGNPTSTTVANYALQNISGWLGLKSPPRRLSKPKTGTKSVRSFQDNYDKDALLGRTTPAPVSQRIASAQQGAPPVYNEDAMLVDDDGDHEDSLTNGSIVSSRNSVDSDQDTIVPDADQVTNPPEVLSGEEERNSEVAKDKGSATKKSVSWKEPVEEEPEEPDHEEPKLHDPTHEELNSEKSSSDSETNDDDDDGPSSPAST